MGRATPAERGGLAEKRCVRKIIPEVAHHRCLGSRRILPYSARRGQKSVNRENLDALKREVPLLDYLRAIGWRPAKSLRGGRWMGLCPLHQDHKPSFLLDPQKNLFYCYGCSRGGDVIRLAELYHQVKFLDALAILRKWRGWTPLHEEVVAFYRIQLHRHPEGVDYLLERGIRSPEVIEYMRIGYAPGRCLRAWLMQLGFALSDLRQAGLVTADGYDTYSHRIIFPLECNLYGRSITVSPPPHRLLPGSKGGLYGWHLVQHCPAVILVEGLFDYAVLWQAGFRQVTCSLGNHLNLRQFQQLCDGMRTVYVTFDADANGSGQRASQRVADQLRGQGIDARHVVLPDGHDPNSFFVQGGNERQFQLLLEAAQS
jgi:DNA primase